MSESFREPLLIFTDGAGENGKATGGAASYNPSNGQAKVFAINIPCQLVSIWLEEVGDQLISQIELFVYLPLRFHYRHALVDSVGIAWIDNEAARFVAIKGSSDSFSMLAMSRVLQQVELEMPFSMWLERVSSFSNPSDMPSRNMVKQAALLLKADESGAISVPESLVDAILLLRKTFAQNVLPR